jgi:hypothetical protein
MGSLASVRANPHPLPFTPSGKRGEKNKRWKTFTDGSLGFALRRVTRLVRIKSLQVDS